MDHPSENELWGHYGEGVARNLFNLEMDRGSYHDARDSHGNPYEVKCCQLTVGVRADPGKFFIRWENHQKLRECDGFYTLILYDPQEWRRGPILGIDVKSAGWLDSVDRPWTANGSRRNETVKRPVWTDVFSPEDVIPDHKASQTIESAGVDVSG